MIELFFEECEREGALEDVLGKAGFI